MKKKIEWFEENGCLGGQRGLVFDLETNLITKWNGIVEELSKENLSDVEWCIEMNINYIKERIFNIHSKLNQKKTKNIKIMKVSMDGLRWQLLSNYNALTRKLNKGMNNSKTETTVDVYDVEGNMEVIRQCIVTLAYMFDDREDGFKELDNPLFEEFNSKEE